jgi:hypothetical protein
MNLRARIARLDALIPEDGDRLCCLEGFAAWRDLLAPHYATLEPHLDLDPGNPAPPLEPPELPELPLEGVCRKTGETLCPFALDLTRRHWTRRRRLAVNFAGLDESNL